MQDRFANIGADGLRMLDALLEGGGGAWWDEFFADRSRRCPFFVEWPGQGPYFGEDFLWALPAAKGAAGAAR